MPKSFNINIEEKIGCIWITFNDSIDMDNYKLIEDEIFHKIKSDTPRNIVLDLSKTSALFSSGIGLIIRLHSFVEKFNKKIYLVNVSQKVSDSFIMTGLNAVLTIFSTEEEFKKKICSDSDN
ncbi:MAG: STAS domain-containing protein [Chitinispirillia bacterium]|jgi:anti-anti-sigma factor